MKTINRSFAFASDVAGFDFEQLKLLCSILDLSGPPDSYDTTHQGVIHSTLLQHSQTRLVANRKHSFDNALCHKNGKTVIAVKTDSSKRGVIADVGTPQKLVWCDSRMHTVD